VLLVTSGNCSQVRDEISPEGLKINGSEALGVGEIELEREVPGVNRTLGPCSSAMLGTVPRSQL
jgi:hypothetical protein